MVKPTIEQYANNVFINCPFDENYRPFFNAIVFSIQICGFIPRCALEYENSDKMRLDKIIELISSCQYSIHDLSLLDTRFNMPLELGILIGCKAFGSSIHNEKEYLIFEGNEGDSYQYFSDLKGHDIKAHNNDLQILIQYIRSWLSAKTQKRIPHTPYLLKTFKDFNKILPTLCATEQYIKKELNFKEYSSLLNSWLERTQTNS